MPPGEVYVGVGANLGDARRQCQRAVEGLSSLPGFTVTLVSSLYATEPVETQGGWFVNCVLGGETTLSPPDLLRALRGIETEMGRPPRRERGTARVIDLDLLLYGPEIIATPELTVPHPRMHERRFVLEPLAEIAPQVRHPLLHATVTELRARLHDPHEVRKLAGPPIFTARREENRV